MTLVATRPVRKIGGLGTGDALHDQVLRLYSSTERELRILIERILGRQISATNLAALATAFETGSIARVEAAIDFTTLGAALQSKMGPVMQRAFERGGNLALEQFPAQITTGFNVLDPGAVRFFERFGAESVREITLETQAAIRAAISGAYQQGLGARAAAKEIRSVIGLTRRQGRAVTNFRRALIEAIESGAPAAHVRSSFALSRNVVNARNMKLANVDKLTRTYQARWITHRSSVIARNESVRAVSAGRHAFWEQARDSGALGKDDLMEWMTSADERTCPICIPLHGVQVPLGGEFKLVGGGSVTQPPAHVLCLPGYTRVAPRGRIMAATKRWIDGELIVIKCAGGLPLSATPNHPVLTRRGWVAAGALNVGDEIFYSGQQRGALPIEEIVREFQSVGETELLQQQSSMFHGDGMEDGVVSVTRAYACCRPYEQSVRSSEHGVHRAKERECGPVTLCRTPPGLRIIDKAQHHVRALLANLSGPFGAQGIALVFGGSSQVVCAGCAGSTLARFAFGVREILGNATALLGSLSVCVLGSVVSTEDYYALQPLVLSGPSGGGAHSTHRTEPYVDTSPGGPDNQNKSYMEINMATGMGIASDARLEKIRGIQRKSFSGYVYNLETTEGYYLANGIVTHNCRCDTRIVTAAQRKEPKSQARIRTDRRIEELRAEAAERERARRRQAS